MLLTQEETLMKHLIVIASCAACFILGTLVPLRTTNAQQGATTPAKTTYYDVSFMKSLPGQDPISLEKEHWTPIHKDLLQRGTIKSWTVLQPIYSGPHNYDYMTIIAFDDINALNNIDYGTLFKKHWGESTWQSIMQKTEASRDMLGNEIWAVAARVSNDDK
jgi:hypothetical protein